MRLRFSACFSVLPAVLLTGCGFTQVRETVHRSVAVSGSPSVHVTNSIGGVTIRGWDKPSVDVEAVKTAHSADDLKNIGINVESRPTGVFVTTVNNAGGGLWSGGGVGYTIMVPADASLDITNDTGGIRISGVAGDVVARASTGAIKADLGTVAGKRNIDMRVKTGGVDVSIAPDRNATVDMHATVGGVKSTFPSDRIGSGSARIHLETTTGGVSLHA